jgi:hypothetical protein
VQRTIELRVRAPIDQVFAVLADVTRTAEWHPATVEERWVTDPPHGVGSRRLAVSRSMGIRSENIAEVTVFEPPSALGLRTLDAPVPTEISIRLERAGTAATDVRWTTAMTPTGAGRPIARLALGAFTRTTRTGLDELARLLEGAGR